MARASGEDPYDLAIIGSGGAGFSAAIAARRKDRRVVMVDRDRIGGTCVNSGCVPSKALLAAAQARQVATEAGQRFPGIATTAGPVDPVALLAGKQALVEQLQADKYIDLAAAYGWEVLGGHARFVADLTDGDGPTLQVDLPGDGTRRIRAAYYLIATGSAPCAPPIPGLDDVGYLTSTTAMELDELPGSLLVVGGNAVGLEQAQLFARLGSKVTVVELLDRLAPLEEPEAGAAIAGVFADEGITVHAGAQVARVARDGEGDVVATVRHHDGSTVELRAEGLLVAAGRRPVTDGLGLEAVGVKVGERGRTTPGSGPPGTSPERRSSSTSPPRTAPWWPTTLWTAPAGRWTTGTCPGSSSPARSSPRSASPISRSSNGALRARAGSCRWTRCLARWWTATPAGWSRSWPSGQAGGCLGSPWSPTAPATQSRPRSMRSSSA